MDTRQLLIENAIGIVRNTGYAGFSYAALSAVVGIRKASIHHHFPGKGDLGVAMVDAYRERFAAQLDAITAERTTLADRLRAYVALYRSSLTEASGCLCGTLAAEMAHLPPPVQASVRRFFTDNIVWLESHLAGRKRSTRGRAGSQAPRQAARLLLAALQGALLMARAEDDATAFDSAADAAVAAALG